MEENNMVMSIPTTGPQWVEKAPMETVRTKIGAEVLNGKIHVFGGLKNYGQSLADLEIYDPKSNRWTNGTPMPENKYRFASAVLDGKIYAIGGEGGRNNSLIIYDPETASWENGTQIPTPRPDLIAVVTGGKIYAMGGYLQDSGVTDLVEIYDVKSNSWKAGTSLPIPMSNFGAAVWDDKIYIFGGVNKSTISKIFIYDLKTKTWKEGPSMPAYIYYLTANQIGDKVYLVGGATPTESALNTVYIFDLISNTWSRGPDLKQGREDHASVVIDQTIYVIGGQQTISGSTTTFSSMESLNLSANDRNPKLSVLLNPEETVQISVSNSLTDNAMLTWRSSSEAVATVDANGKATAVAVGLSDITATNVDESFQEFISVRVLPGTADLYRLAVHLTPGESKQLGMTEDLEGVTWKSMDESVVTVDTNGKITAVANGLAIIEATVGSDVQHIYVRVKAEV